MIAFISGHLKITDDEFTKYYVGRILEAVRQGHSFVIGDAVGVDNLAQQLLKNYKNAVTVYHMLEKPRYNQDFPTIGGYTSDDERDAAMTAASDYDIAWVRPGKENSGTAKNIARRKMKDLQ